jgi:putative intracellular protease/amidase
MTLRDANVSSPSARKRIAMVIANPAVSTTTGWPVGFWSHGLPPRDKHVMPWRIEDEMNAIGANYVQAGLWRSFAVRDGIVSISEDATATAMRRMGMPEEVVETMSSLNRIIAAGYVAELTDTVRAVTGCAPRTLPAFAQEHAAARR